MSLRLFRVWYAKQHKATDTSVQMGGGNEMVWEHANLHTVI